MKKWLLPFVSIVLTVLISTAAYLVLTNTMFSNKPLNYTYSMVNTYPHDPTAFTEGLVYESGVLYESTGLVGDSSVRKVDLETGTVLQSVSLGDDFFGEGLTAFGDSLIQLTWQSEIGLVYNKTSFNSTQRFRYQGEGWGITHDNSRLIMSNGSAILTFLDPHTFKPIGTVQVSDGDNPVINLNELEYVNGDVYANIWHQDRIAIINIQTGQVKGWVNLSGIYRGNGDTENVLNGIAYDAIGNRLFVTGKRWSQLFEIKLEPSS